MKQPETDKHLIAEITRDYLNGVPLPELSYNYGIPVQRLTSMFVIKPKTTFSENLNNGIKLLDRAERILFRTAKDYHLLPKEDKKALDSLLLFYSKADVNNHKWANLEAVVEKFI